MPPISLSIITACYNSAGTIADCLQSVNEQSYPAEHIIVDGASKDRTLKVVQQVAPECVVLSEPDRGIYDAMNKGIALATGDVVGILNSDDFYVDSHVLEKVAQVFSREDVDAVFADVVFVKPDDLGRVVRYYRGTGFKVSDFSQGLMPPHPTFFVKRECYEKYGLYRTDFKIAADFDLMLRFMATHKINFRYLPETLVKMRTGGTSTRSLKSNIILNKEILQVCLENGVDTSLLRIYTKYLSKCFQLVARPHGV